MSSIDIGYEPDHGPGLKGKRVQKHDTVEREVPHLWVVFRCADAKHVGSVKLDAYQGPPYCKEHLCYLQPVNLGVEHIETNRRSIEAHQSAKGRPNT